MLSADHHRRNRRVQALLRQAFHPVAERCPLAQNLGGEAQGHPWVVPSLTQEQDPRGSAPLTACTSEPWDRRVLTGRLVRDCRRHRTPPLGPRAWVAAAALARRVT